MSNIEAVSHEIIRSYRGFRASRLPVVVDAGQAERVGRRLNATSQEIPTRLQIFQRHVSVPEIVVPGFSRPISPCGSFVQRSPPDICLSTQQGGHVAIAGKEGFRLIIYQYAVRVSNVGGRSTLSPHGLLSRGSHEDFLSPLETGQID